MEFEDRVSAYPNRYLMTTESGSASYVILERADEPVTPGTPLNADTFNAMQQELSGLVGGSTESEVPSVGKLNNVPGTPIRASVWYVNLEATGLVSQSTTTEAVVMLMPNESQFAWSHTTNTTIYLTDAPSNFGVVVLMRGYSDNYIHGWFFSHEGEIYKYKYNASTTRKNGWTKVLGNVLSSDEYGTTLPAAGTVGRIFFKKV